MRPTSLVFTTLALGLLAGTAAAQECPSYLGTKVQPQSFNVVSAQMSRLPRTKDEYETTAAFEARQTAAASALPGHFVVSTPLDMKYVEYDADARKLRIKTYAIDNTRTNYSGVFGFGSPLAGKVTFSSENINVVVETTEKRNGSYAAKNAFGAEVQVQRVKRSTKAVFDRIGAYYENLFFDSRGYITGMPTAIAEFPDATPEFAKDFKRLTRAALVVVPKAPFYAKGPVPWGEPTATSPFEIDETLEVVIADIRCVLLVDPTGQVQGSIATRTGQH
jgi:hypothetical protein